MIDFEEALKTVLLHSSQLTPVAIPVTDAIGKVLAETITAPVNLPPFTKAMVDGYAVNSEDAKDKKAIQEIVGSIFPGVFPDLKLERGQAMEIQAEAPVPNGSDAVVKKNAVRILMNGSRVGMLHRVKKGEDVIVAGENLKKDETVLKAGTCLRAVEICLLTMTGIAKVKIYPLPRVAVLSLGDELVDVGKKIKRGQAWDSNGISLTNALYELGSQPEYLGVVSQNVKKILEAIKKADTADVLLITGVNGASRRLLLLDAFRKADIKIIFEGVSIKPGSSIMFAKLGQTLIFVLPENPFSILTLFEILITPVLRRMMGFDKLYSSTFEVILEKKIKTETDYWVVQPATVFFKNGKIVVKPAPLSKKANIFSFARCNALMIIPKHVRVIKKGKPVKVILIRFPYDFCGEK